MPIGGYLEDLSGQKVAKNWPKGTEFKKLSNNHVWHIKLLIFLSLNQLRTSVLS